MKAIGKTILASLALGLLLHAGLVTALSAGDFGIPGQRGDTSGMVRFWDRNSDYSFEEVEPFTRPPTDAPLGCVPAPAREGFAFVGWFREINDLSPDVEGFYTADASASFSATHLRPKYQEESTPAEYYAVWADATMYQAAVIDEAQGTAAVYEDLDAAVADAQSSGGLLTLLADVSAGPSPVIAVPEGQTLTLDLNGHGMARDGSPDDQSFLENSGTLTVENSSDQAAQFQSGTAPSQLTGSLLTNRAGAVVPMLRDISTETNAALENSGIIETLQDCQFCVSSPSVNDGEIHSLCADFTEAGPLEGAPFLSNTGSLHLTGGSFTLMSPGDLVQGGGTLTFPPRQTLPAPNGPDDCRGYAPGRYTLVPLLLVSFYDEDRTTLLDCFEAPCSETVCPAYAGEAPIKPDSWEGSVRVTYRFSGWQTEDGDLLTDEEIGLLRADTTLFAAYTPTQQVCVAQVEETLYPTLQEAMQAVAASGQPGEVQLLSDVSLAAPEDAIVLPAAVRLTLDLQGHTLTALSGVSGPAITNQGALTLKGGQLRTQSADCLAVRGGQVSIPSGQLVSEGDACAAVSVSGGSLDLCGGQLQALGDDGCGVAVRGGSVTITGESSVSGRRAAIQVTGNPAGVTLAGGYYRGGVLGAVSYGEGMALSAFPNQEGYCRVAAPQQASFTPTVTGDLANVTVPESLPVEPLAPLVLSASAGGGPVKQSRFDLPAPVLARMGLTTSLTFQTDLGQVTFDRAALADLLAGTQGAGASLSLAALSPAQLPAAQQNAAATAQKILQLTLTSGGGNLTFSGGTATVRLPFTPPEGRSPEQYWVYALSEDGVKTPVPSWYENAVLFFSTPHFSTYLVDDAPCYGMTLSPDGSDYNAGETISAAVYATSTQTGVFREFQFTPYWDASRLDLEEVTADLPDCTVIGDASSGYTVSGAGMTVGTEPVPIARVTFRVKDSPDPGHTALTLHSAAMTPLLPTPALSPQVTGKEVSLHNIRITLRADENSTVSGGGSVTLFAKYQQPGLCQSPGAAPVTTLPIDVHTGYRLADAPWTDGIQTYADFAALADLSFSQDTTFTLQTVKTCTISFSPGSQGPASALPPITVDAGTPVPAGTLPQPTAPHGYTFTGWSLDGQPIGTGCTPTDNVTLSPCFSPLLFSFHYSAPHATTAPSGLTDQKEAAYGADLRFQVSPLDGYTITAVHCTIGGNESLLTPDTTGVYTIPGEKILDDVAVTVTTLPYHTLLFQASGGTSLSPATAYFREGLAGLFADATFTNPFLFPTPTASNGYRLAQDTPQDPLWQDGSGGMFTSSALANTFFGQNFTLFPRVIPVWNVSFQAGAGGQLLDNLPLTVDHDSVLTADQLPSPAGRPGYVFDQWSPAIGRPITGNTVFTAQFRRETYPIRFVGGGAAFQVTNGGTQEAVTCGRDVTFQLTAAAGTRITGVFYTVGEGSAQALAPVQGEYTIPGGAITGPVTVSVTTQETVVVTFVAGDHGSLTGPLTVTVDKGTALTQDLIPTPQGAPGFHLQAWWAQGAAVTPVGYVATAPVTLTATFDSGSFPVTLPSGLTGPAATAAAGVSYTFTPASAGHIVTGLCYAVNNGEPQALLPQSDGSYTIPADQITGPITLSATLVEGTFSLLPFDQYKAAAPGKQLVLLESPPVPDSHYVLSDGEAFYWSARYQAYVRFVKQGETAASLAAKLTAAAGPGITVGQTGDLDGSGAVTAADAAFINDLLHGKRTDVSDRMRLEMDVDGSNSVTTSDIQWILDAAIGKLH